MKRGIHNPPFEISIVTIALEEEERSDNEQ